MDIMEELHEIIIAATDNDKYICPGCNQILDGYTEKHDCFYGEEAEGLNMFWLLDNIFDDYFFVTTSERKYYNTIIYILTSNGKIMLDVEEGRMSFNGENLYLPFEVKRAISNFFYEIYNLS